MSQELGNEELNGLLEFGMAAVQEFSKGVNQPINLTAIYAVRTP